jgi:hypothetical protein
MPGRGVMRVMLPNAEDRVQERSGASGGDALFEPETGITCGQAYFERFLQRSSIGDNLIYLAAARPGASDPLARGARRRGEFAAVPGIDPDPGDPRLCQERDDQFLDLPRAVGQFFSSLKALVSSAWRKCRATDGKSALHAWNWPRPSIPAAKHRGSPCPTAARSRPTPQAGCWSSG